MNVILFGPPGIGKSTLIGILKTKGFGAIDLEDLYPNRLRFQIPNVADAIFIGGADLNPKRVYPNSVKVFLDADQTTYEQRRAERDKKFPDKGNQAAHLIADWKTGVKYDHIVKTTSPLKTASSLIAIWRRYNGKR